MGLQIIHVNITLIRKKVTWDGFERKFCGFIYETGITLSGVKLVRQKEKKVEPHSTHCFVGN